MHKYKWLVAPISSPANSLDLERCAMTIFSSASCKYICNGLRCNFIPWKILSARWAPVLHMQYAKLTFSDFPSLVLDDVDCTMTACMDMVLQCLHQVGYQLQPQRGLAKTFAST
jgi:hypothetical protein